MFHAQKTRNTRKRIKLGKGDINLNLPDGYVKIDLEMANSDFVQLLNLFQLNGVKKNDVIDILQCIEFFTLREAKSIKYIIGALYNNNQSTLYSLENYFNLNVNKTQSPLTLIRGAPMFMVTEQGSEITNKFANWTDYYPNTNEGVFRGNVRDILIKKFDVRSRKVTIILDILRRPVTLPLIYFNKIYRHEGEIAKIEKTLKNGNKEQITYKYFKLPKKNNFNLADDDESDDDYVNRAGMMRQEENYINNSGNNESSDDSDLVRANSLLPLQSSDSQENLNGQDMPNNNETVNFDLDEANTDEDKNVLLGYTIETKTKDRNQTNWVKNKTITLVFNMDLF